jgi:hypothetical protein
MYVSYVFCVILAKNCDDFYGPNWATGEFEYDFQQGQRCSLLQSDHAGSGTYAISYPVEGTVDGTKTTGAGSCTGRHFMLKFRRSGPTHLLTFDTITYSC